MIKLTAIFIAIYTLVLAGGSYFTWNTGGQDFSMAMSVLLGGGIMLLNLGGLALMWSMLFSKKPIALAVFIIIFKYVILGLILWNLGSVTWLRPVGLLLGLSSLLFAVLAAVAVKSFTKKLNQN